MSNCFIILAAGQSKRFKSNKPKQYILYKNKPIYEHSVDKVLKSGLFKHVILVVKNNFFIKRKFSKKIKIIKGGRERSDSSLIGLKYAKKLNVKTVVISDDKHGPAQKYCNQFIFSKYVTLLLWT